MSILACWVPNCPTTIVDKITLHQIPTTKEDITRRRFWMKLARIKKPKTYTGQQYICGLHFKDSDYHDASTRIALKTKKFPSIFEWTQAENDKISAENNEKNSTQQSLPNMTLYITNEKERIYSYSLESNLPNEKPEKNIPPELSTVVAQTKAEMFENLKFLITDSNVKYYTGFPTYIHFLMFYKVIREDCVEIVNNYKITDDIKNSVGLSCLTTLEDLFICLVKLRTALPEKIIEDLFNVKQGYLDAIFEPWMTFLANKLQDLPIWLTQEQVKLTTPVHLHQQMKNVRIIIDFIELCVYDLEAEQIIRPFGITTEQHRNKNTFKGIVGMAPSGQITFFSGLRSSKYDVNKLLHYSGLIDNLESGDIIMSNKVFGLKVAKQFKARNINVKLNVIQSDPSLDPAFTKESDGLIRVNGASQGIREFKILGGIIPHTITPLLNSIWIVVNHLANFTKFKFHDIPIVPRK